MRGNMPTVTMPAGEYYIGDLCYVLHDAWGEFCDITIEGHSCIDGKFTLADGRSFVTMQTMYGDGEYEASNGASLGVDAGLIGCIKVSDIRDTDGIALGTVVTFPSDFSCYSKDGCLTFGHISVDTDPPQDYEEEDVDYSDYDDDE